MDTLDLNGARERRRLARQQARDERVAALRREKAVTRNRIAGHWLAMEPTWKAQWRGGHVVPWRITMMLDARGLYGPEVDEACGVQEPTVDLWEEGAVYPTWPQLVALAKLCETTPGFFMDDRALPPRPMPWWRSHFAMDLHEKFSEPVLRFTAEALREHMEALDG